MAGDEFLWWIGLIRVVRWRVMTGHRTSILNDRQNQNTADNVSDPFSIDLITHNSNIQLNSTQWRMIPIPHLLVHQKHPSKLKSIIKCNDLIQVQSLVQSLFVRLFADCVSVCFTESVCVAIYCHIDESRLRVNQDSIRIKLNQMIIKQLLFVWIGTKRDSGTCEVSTQGNEIWNCERY